MITAIVAVDSAGGIGLKGKLPWKNSEDLRFFRGTTMGKTVIMGRVTWESLPKRPLEGRRNIVISSEPVFGAESYPNLEGAIEHLNKTDEHFIIGGEQVYKTAFKMEIVDRVVLSKIEGEHQADKFFDNEMLDGFSLKYVNLTGNLEIQVWNRK